MIRLVKTKSDYQAALTRIEQLFGSKPGTPEHQEFEVLAALVELYEQEHHHIGPPEPVEAIKFRMDQLDLKPKDLAPYIGSRGKASEVLSGKRSLSLSMMRALHTKLGVPADVLLREQRDTVSNPALEQPEKLPWHEILKRGWIPKEKLPRNPAKPSVLIRHFLDNVRPSDVQAAFYRRNVRAAHVDPFALFAWTVRIVSVASEAKRTMKTRNAKIDSSFLRGLASCSYFDDGPVLAREFLFKHGIILVVEPHLPRTHLDGAATKLDDGTPVIALSLRHDRVDNFWFSLFHELAHLQLHLSTGDVNWFVDDFDVADSSQQESEADAWARDQLIQPKAWDQIEHCETAAEIQQAADKLHISAAIIAGRLRRERKNYKIFSSLVGYGEVRRRLLPP